MTSEKKKESNRENLKKAVAERKLKHTVEKECQYCGKICSVALSQIKKGWRHCSRDCRYKNMVGSKAPNAGGGAWMMGKNNINYKHGKSSETLARDLTKVNRWRRRIFERDRYKCQKCGDDKGGNLRAHHIKTWANFPELRYELTNGITLCDSCHKWVHSKRNIEKEYL